MFVTKALRGVIPSKRDFPYDFHLDVLSPKDTSPMPSVCGGSMALMDAGIPLQCHVAGASIGLVIFDETSNGQLEKYRMITDLLGLEDGLVEMDCKLAGTRNGITAIQLDVKSAGISLDIICEALSYGREASLQILEHMERVINSPNKTCSILENNPEKMPLVARDAEVGELYECIVKSIRVDGALVEYYGGRRGLLYTIPLYIEDNRMAIEFYGGRLCELSPEKLSKIPDAYRREMSYEKVSKLSDELSIDQRIILKCNRISPYGIPEFSLENAPQPKIPQVGSVAEVGELYECIVRSIDENISLAVVEYNGDRYGGIYKRELSNEEVSKLSDVLSIDQCIILKCISFTKGGCAKFSLKAVA